MGMCNLQDTFEKENKDTNDEEMHREDIEGAIGSIDNSIFELSHQRFENRDDLLNLVRNFASTQGYAISIKDSKRDKFVVIRCDRGGSYRNRWKLTEETRKRKTASRLINCPFEVVGKKNVNGLWVVEVLNALHNHEPSVDMSAHPSCRHFSSKEILRIKEMTMTGIPTRQILSSLRQNNPNLLATSQSVHNMKVKIFKEFLDGRTLVQALIDDFSKSGFTYNVEYDEGHRVTHLFFAHPVSIALTKNYSNIFLMDCTYKTNRYKMPLLDIVGVSSLNTTFYSSFAFIEKEREMDYIWALRMFSNILDDGNQPLVIVTDRELALMNAIRVVFPNAINLLCVWHIQKNIVTKCKSHFLEGEDWDGFLVDWTSLVTSDSELVFNHGLHNFEEKYKEKVHVLDYIRGTWIPYKEFYVKAWTDRYLHFGNRATSRVEGAHSRIKTYLESSAGNLYGVRNRICLAIENQFQEIKTQLGREKLRIPHRFRIPLFKELITRVSMFALDEILKQYEMVKSELELSHCKGQFMRTMGLPCAHKIKYMKHEALKLDDIHPHWRIDTKSFMNDGNVQNHKNDQLGNLFEDMKQKYQGWSIDRREAALKQISSLIDAPNPFLYEPKIDIHKGRPTNSKRRKETSSTKRDPSAFEIVERARKCGLCKGVGHNSRTCHLKHDGFVLQPTSTYINLEDQVEFPGDAGMLLERKSNGF